MKKYTFILFILLSAACERQLNVDFSNEKSLIVMHGVVEPGKPISVRVGKSFSILDNDSNAAYLKDAAVELHINGKFVEKMQLEWVKNVPNSSSRGGTSGFISSSSANIGDHVRIEASAPGMETAWAETVIPEPPSIRKVDTASYITIIKIKENGLYNYQSNYYKHEELTLEPFLRMLRLHIEMERAHNDAAQYYFLSLSSVMPPDNPYSRGWLFTGTKDDPIFGNDPKEDILNGLFEKNYGHSGSSFFSDKGFKSNIYTLNVTTYGFYKVNIEYHETEEGVPSEYKSHTVENLPIEIRISSLSPDWHAYLKSLDEKSYDEGDISFFSEPKTTKTNVHNGIGFLGAMSHATKIIDTPPFTGKENEVPR